MDHASPEPGDLLERGRHIRDGEVRQRGCVARPGATFVNAEHRSAALGLPAATLGLAALGKLDTEQPRPEATRAFGITSRELDQAERSIHVADDNDAACSVAMALPAVASCSRLRSRGTSPTCAPASRRRKHERDRPGVRSRMIACGRERGSGRHAAGACFHGKGIARRQRTA
jgi:hypothetical protein